MTLVLLSQEWTISALSVLIILIQLLCGICFIWCWRWNQKKHKKVIATNLCRTGYDLIADLKKKNNLNFAVKKNANRFFKYFFEIKSNEIWFDCSFFELNEWEAFDILSKIRMYQLQTSKRWAYQIVRFIVLEWLHLLLFVWCFVACFVGMGWVVSVCLIGLIFIFGIADGINNAVLNIRIYKCIYQLYLHHFPEQASNNSIKKMLKNQIALLFFQNYSFLICNLIWLYKMFWTKKKSNFLLMK